MTIIDDNKIYDEVERFYRNNDILTTTIRNVTTANDTGTFSSDTSHLIDKTNVKNIRSIIVSSTTLKFGTDYTYITDYNDSGTYKTQINFTSAQTGSYTISYDYGSDKIFADWPRSDLTLKSFPRIAITFGAKQTEDIAIGGTTKRTYIPFTVTVVKDNNREINDILKIVREVSLLNQKDFYYIDYIATTGDTPVLPYSESVQELQQKGLEFKALLPLEEIPF